MKNLESARPQLVVLLSFSILLLVPGCRKDRPLDPAGSFLKLRLVPTWEGQPFLPFVEHINTSNYRVQVEKVQFYLGDIRLTNEGASASLSPIQLATFNDGPVEFHLPVAAGTWSGLSMALGVPEELNHSDPTLYDNLHPLSVSNGMHWNWTIGYVFMKFEGRYDLDPNSTGIFPSTYSIHTGFNEVYTDMHFEPSIPITFTANDTATITINVAVDRFFHSQEGGVIDLATENQSHGMNVPLSVKLTTNAVNSFTLE